MGCGGECVWVGVCVGWCGVGGVVVGVGGWCVGVWGVVCRRECCGVCEKRESVCECGGVRESVCVRGCV